jgi:hypothetical protein
VDWLPADLALLPKLAAEMIDKNVEYYDENAGFTIRTNEVGHDNRPGRESEMWVEVIASKT